MNTCTPIVFIVDDEPPVLRALSRMLQGAGLETQTFDSPVTFLEAAHPDTPGCVILDMAMPELTGLEVQRAVVGSPSERPIIFLTGHQDLGATVHAMKAGAVDFLTKPVERQKLLPIVLDALRIDSEMRYERSARLCASKRVASLTRREREVFERIICGRLNKQIAGDLGTVEKTVKVHRARVMQKLGVRSVAALVMLALTAGIARCATMSESARQAGIDAAHEHDCQNEALGSRCKGIAERRAADDMSLAQHRGREIEARARWRQENGIVT